MKISTIHSRITVLFALISLSSVGANILPSNARQTDAVVFAVIGDYGIAGQAEADVANLVKSWNPNFIVTVGDNNYPNGAAYSIDQNVGQYYHDYIFRYDGKYGNGSDTRRFFPAMGNHDWHNYSPNPYLNYFNLPGNERYYDFIQGPVHFFILNSVEHEPDGNTADSGQGKWLKNVLSNSTSRWNVVVTHYPPYSSGKHGVVPFMQWPFKEWGADAVFAGHDHDYERLFVNGMPHFVNGLGGDELGNFRPEILPQSQFHYNANYGAMRVEANGSLMKFQFYSRDNILIDEYTLGSSVPTATSITNINPRFTNANNLDFNVAFSEPVFGVDASDFIVTTNGVNGAYVSNVSGADSNYIVSVNTGMGDGTLRLDLMDNDSIINSSNMPLANSGMGNGNLFSEIYTLDKTAPVVTSIMRASSSPSNAAAVDFSLTFSEPVFGLDISDLSLSSANGFGGAGLVNINGSGASYLVSVSTGSGDDILRLDMASNSSVTDAIGNPLASGFTSGESYTVDKTSPVVISILRASPNPTNAAFVDFNVAFSEPVSGVDASDFILSAANISGTYITNINGSRNSYTVSVNTGSNSGDLRLDLVSDTTIMDGIGNRLVAPFNTGESYAVNKSVPIVLSILRAGANITNASNVDFNIAFSEPVIGVDMSDFVLKAEGVNAAAINGVSGSGAAYTVSVSAGIGNGTIRLEVADDNSIRNSIGNMLGGANMNDGNFIGETYEVSKSAVAAVTADFPAPSLTYPARNPLLTSTPELSWLNIRDVISYEVVIARDAEYTQVAAAQIVSATIFTSPPLTDGAYYWRVRAYNANNQPGKFSVTESFTIDATPPAAPVLLSPSNDARLSARFKFLWTKISDATRYHIEIDNNEDFSSPEWTSWRRDPEYQTSSMRKGIYYWHVRAKDMAGNWSAWSFAFKLTVP